MIEGASERILDAAEARLWARRAAGLLGDRRIARTFFPARTLRSTLEHLAPTPGEPRQTVALHPESGLPVLEDLLRARARSRAAQDEHAVERFRVEARLRRTEGRDSALKVVVDRFDPTASVFLRATLELVSHRSDEVSIDGDRAELSGTLRDTLFRYAGSEPELLYLRLCGVDGITVRSVTVGQTGPLYQAAMAAPAWLAPVLAEGWALLCRQTRVSPELDEHRYKDRTATSLQERVGDAAHAELQRTFSSNYGLLQDAIWVVERPALAALRAALPGAVLYPTRPVLPEPTTTAGDA